jgi:hypothetical protein
MRRIWLYGALIAVATGLLVSTSGFTAMSAERPVTVAVADDENAILGIQTLDGSGTVNETVAVLKITNNFDHEVDVDVVGGDIDASKSLESGAFWDVSTDCEDTGRVTVDITASGSGVHVTTSETVSMDCTPTTTQTTQTTTTT